MRSVIVSSLAGWLVGAASIVAQGPMPSPYANYAPAPPRGYYVDGSSYEATRHGPGLQLGLPPQQTMAPQYGPVRGPSYGPMMPASGGRVIQAGANEPAGAPLPMPYQGPSPMPPGNGYPMQASNGPMTPGQSPGMVPGPGWNNGVPPDGAWNNRGWNGCGEGCWDGNCGYGNCSRCPCGPCGPPGRMWIGAELLLWWTTGQNLPPLVTSGTGLANPGVLGQPGTVIVFGNQTIGNGMRPGMRTRVGLWLDECQNLGVEASFLFLAGAADDYQSVCRVGDVLSRPFFNTDPAVNAQDAELICMPAVLCGHVNVSSYSEFYVADANMRRALCCNANVRVDVVGGFRYQHLGDDLVIQENLTNLDITRGAIGEGFIVQDRFVTNCDFYGGQFGAAGEFRAGRVFLDWRALVALGSTVQAVTIAGQTTFLDPVVGGNPVTQPGGLLAQPSNIGTYRSSDFSVIPEVNVNAGVQVTPLVRAYVGYSFLYWNNVTRAADQINLNVDARQLPTRAGPGVGTDPRFILRASDFWAHGVNFGLQLRW